MCACEYLCVFVNVCVCLWVPMGAYGCTCVCALLKITNTRTYVHEIKERKRMITALSRITFTTEYRRLRSQQFAKLLSPVHYNVLFSSRQ